VSPSVNSSANSSAWANLVASPNLTASPLSTSGAYTYYTPQEIRSAYAINQAVLPNGQLAGGAGQTIAIVDAYHDPNIASDLAAFDAAYGLAAPPSFTQVQLGGVTQVNSGWAGETALDVEWAHAVAPQANILLVEAPTATYSELLASVQYAAAQPGVVAVSMSWGGSEFYNETAYDRTFTTPSGHVGGSGLPGGVTFVASSGDSGAWYGAQWPAVSPNVLVVGGTALYLNSQSQYSAESAWSGSGGGYSIFESEPSFQQGAQRTGRRTSPDVSYDANPYTGFVVRNSFGLQSVQTGWWISGGTSAGAPQWAGIIALADQARAVNGLGSLNQGQTSVYSLSTSDFHDITSGSNGYSAIPGYDLASGRGSPYVDRIVADLSGASSTLGSNTIGTNHSFSGLQSSTNEVSTSLRYVGAQDHSYSYIQTTIQPANALHILENEQIAVPALPYTLFEGSVGIEVLVSSAVASADGSKNGLTPEVSVNSPSQGPLVDLPFNSLGITDRPQSGSIWDEASIRSLRFESSITEDLAAQVLLSQPESSDSSDGAYSVAATQGTQETPPTS
jgi:subtilase family serine protease